MKLIKSNFKSVAFYTLSFINISLMLIFIYKMYGEFSNNILIYIPFILGLIFQGYLLFGEDFLKDVN